MRTVAALTALLLTGCAARAAPDPGSSPPRSAELARARAVAAAGDHARADSLLELLATRHPLAPDAADVLYLRALLHLDPTNVNASRSTAARLLDAYLEGDEQTYGMEARSLHALVTKVDSLEAYNTVEPDTLVAVQDTLARVRERERELERENARLRESLDRANAELERIRRRLAAPPRR